MEKLDRRKYENSKKIVKKWEKEFKETARRTPRKTDIKCAPDNIKEAYKTYWKLKTIALETSLAEVVADENAKDCFNSSGEKIDENGRKSGENSVNDDSQCFVPVSEFSLSQFDVSNSRSHLGSNSNRAWEKSKSDSNLLREKSAELNFKNKIEKNDQKELNIWGEHLNKRNVEPGPSTSSKPKKATQKTITDVFAEKILRGATFKKLRNPRKPFVRSKTTGSFNFPVKPQEIVAFSSSMFEESKPGVESKVFLKEEPEKSALNGGNAKIVTKAQGLAVHALSLIQTMSSETPVVSKFTKKTVDQGWLDRVSQSVQSKNETTSQDSGFDDMSQLTQRSECTKDTVEDDFSDDLDLIVDSDSESQPQCMKPQKPVHTELPRSSLPSLPSTSKEVGPPEVSKTKRQDDDSELPVAKKTKLDQLEGSERKISSTKREIVEASERTRRQKKPPKRIPTADEKKKMALLEKKLASGKANENFVAINIEKKVFVRGQKKGTYTNYKKKMWKELRKENMSTTGIRKCFKCGDVGHFSKSCPKAGKGLFDFEDADSEDESPFPTLDQVSEMAKEAGDRAHNGKRKFTKPVPQPAEEELQSCEAIDENVRDDLEFDMVVDPLYPTNEDGSLIDTPPEVYDTLRQFGHSSFLEGQEQAIMRILSGKSTLVTMSTGSGKSLCYQIPAALHHKKDSSRIALVISPLVSLMDDQVNGLDEWNEVACYHTNMTQKKRDEVIERIKRKELAALLLSPETLVSLEAGSARPLLSAITSIAFACIDEAHCLHQWCHNFRPSYLTVTQVLREKLKVKTLLGLTATASSSTVEALRNHLGVDPNDDSAVISDRPLPDNLSLTVSKTEAEREKQEALLELLNSVRFASCRSIIVYCTRRETCDRVAGFLRTSMQDEEGPQKYGRLSCHAEVYHAGLTAAKRSSVQKAFMTGKLRIVVATVAFGMGINKPDIRGIIHYTLPSTFENYVQEVGRAGRDGQPAQCHLLLDSKKQDLGEIRRHIYSDTIDRYVIRKLLQLVFLPCMCPPGKCPKHEVAFPIEDTVLTLDIPQENVSTLLAYLELDDVGWIKVLPLTYSKCRVTSYKGPNHLKAVAKTCPPLAMAWAEAQKKTNAPSTLEFDIFELSRKINWDSGIIKRVLKNLEWTQENASYKKSGTIVEFSTLSFRVLAPGNLPEDQLDKALDVLNSTVLEHERSRLAGLQAFYSSLSKIAFETVTECSLEANFERSDTLKKEIRKYFSDYANFKEIKVIEEEILDEGHVAGDICSLIATHRGENNLTGRTIARILHGIGSPNFPAVVWGRTRFWRLHIAEDFNALCRLATRQLILYR